MDQGWRHGRKETELFSKGIKEQKTRQGQGHSYGTPKEKNDIHPEGQDTRDPSDQ